MSATTRTPLRCAHFFSKSTTSAGVSAVSAVSAPRMFVSMSVTGTPSARISLSPSDSSPDESSPADSSDSPSSDSSPPDAPLADSASLLAAEEDESSAPLLEALPAAAVPVAAAAPFRCRSVGAAGASLPTAAAPPATAPLRCRLGGSSLLDVAATACATSVRCS